jgi:hypothetical protein
MKVKKAQTMSFFSGKWSIAALWIVLAGLGSSVFASAQSVSFFGSFQSYPQTAVLYGQGIVADAAGNLYISGIANLAFVPLTANGTPGTPDPLIDGSGSAAYGLAIDSANNLYRPDISSATVAKYTYVSTNTFTKTFIGTGWAHPSSVAVDASFNVYVLDAGTGSIVKLTPNGSTYTQTTIYTNLSQLKGTTGLSMDSAGNFYLTSGPTTGTTGSTFASNSTAAVYKLTPSNGSFTLTSLGSGWLSPASTSVDFEGNIWVTDYDAGTINLLAPSNGGYTQNVYTSIPGIRALTTNKVGQVYGLTAGGGSNGDAVIWTGGSAPHTVAPPPPGGTSTALVTISFPVPTTVSGYTVVTNGSTGQEFTDGGGSSCPAGTYSSGDSCTVNVSFTPQSPGLSTGALVLYGADGAVLGTDYFYGVGQGPMVAFNSAVISTDVGTGNACGGTLSSCGDTGAATSATLNNPNAVIFDAAGDLYIADTADFAVREVTPAGTITAIAGTGLQCASESGTCGDGGTATNATFTSPTGLALDGAGNLYIVDAGANRIREVAAGAGTITTIAGNGTACSSPTAACGDTGAASSATFNMEGYGGAVVDPNANLVIADYGDNRIRSINLNTGVITTVAGTGVACSTSTATCGDGSQAISAQLNGPTGVGIDSSGDYFIADSNDNRVRELSALTSVLSTVAGSGTACTTAPCGDGGAATSAQLNFPLMATTDPAGNVYIADSKDNAIRVVSSATNKIATVAGNYAACTTSTAACGDAGAAPSAQLNTPSGLALNASGNIYIAEATNRIREVNITQTVPLIFPQTNPGSTSAAMSVSLTNIGNAALTFSASPSFPTGFVRDASTTCSTSLAKNATCILATDFTPAVLQNYSGNLVLTDNNLNATTTPGTQQTIVLNGTSIAPVPVLTGISPAIGLVTGGATVTITGTGLTAATSVNFGDTPAASFTVISDTSITAIAPAGSGTVDVTVTTPGGTSAPSPADQFSYQQVQTILFTPPATGVAGTSVTLTATGGTSGNPVIFSVISGLATVSGANGSALTFTGSGTVIVEADQAGAPGYAAAAPVQGSIIVAAAPASYTATTTAVGSPAATQTVYVNFTTSEILGSISVVTQGATGLDFTDAVTGDTCSVGTTYSAGAVCVVNVIFTPNYEGPRYGAVVLKDGSGNLLASSYINGVGTGPQVTFANTTQGNFTPNSVSTLAGSFSFSNPLGLTIDASGNVFIADTGNHAVEEILYTAGVYGAPITLASSFTFNSPYGVAVDGAGNVFVSDNGGQEVYEILAAGGYTTVNPLGNSTSDSNPKGIAVDGAGNVYVSGPNNAVYEIPMAGGYTTSNELGGGFLNPGGLAVDAAGDVFVADSNNLAIKEMPAGCASSACVTQLAGISYPAALAIDGAGDLYIANDGLTEFLAGGSYATSFSLSSSISNANSIAVAPNGNVFFTNGNTVEEFDYADAPSLTYATSTPLGERDKTDGRQTVTVTNIGNAPLTFASVSYAGDFPEASVNSGACSTSTQLAAGTGCTLPVTFMPTSTTGLLNESLVLTDNNLNAIATPGTQQTIALRGTVLAGVAATQAVAAVVLTENHAATQFTPVSGSGGTGTLVYSVSPGLPAGLTLNTSTGAITGTPMVTSLAASYTVTVTDANGGTATASFSLMVDSAVVATQEVASTALTESHAAVAFTPVAGSGGDAPLVYSVSPVLPTGLTFNPSTGAVAGTASVTSSATSYTVTVTDANGGTAIASFSLTVDSAVVATQEVASTTLTQNHAATSFTPVTGSGGTGALVYSVSPGLTAGLMFNVSTGVVTGTPTVMSSATTYTVTVTDANGATATASFSLTVNSVVTATQEVASTTLTQNHAATSFTPATGSGGTVPLTYSVSPGPPAGLTLNANTGAVSGTPSGTSVASIYLVTVTDANGATAQASFSLTVDSAVVATQAVVSTSLTQNQAAVPFTPVAGSGGDAPLTYSISPGLPAGLVLNTSTGAITGTPTGVSVAASYTVTVTDANGATATANFSLTVNSAVVAVQAIGVEALTFYQTITPFTPVTGSGGTTPLTYSVSPGLPRGWC